MPVLEADGPSGSDGIQKMNRQNAGFGRPMPIPDAAICAFVAILH